MISETWVITGTVEFTLPVSCTLYSDYMKCGYVTVVGNDEEDVDLSPAGMEFTKSEEMLVEKLQVKEEEWSRTNLQLLL